MSFYVNNFNNRRPACINPNQLNNICEKVLIETTRVFDACVHRVESEQYTLALSDFSPSAPSEPLTYVSTVNDPNLPIVVTSTRIERSDIRPNFASVSATFTIPLIVNFVDANGVAGTARSSVSVTRSAVLCVPQVSLTPITVRVQAFFSSTIGTFTGDDTITITACLQVILKVVGTVDLLMPTFGYPTLPVCQGGIDADCTALFNEPIYPPPN